MDEQRAISNDAGCCKSFFSCSSLNSGTAHSPFGIAMLHRDCPNTGPGGLGGNGNLAKVNRVPSVLSVAGRSLNHCCDPS